MTDIKFVIPTSASEFRPEENWPTYSELVLFIFELAGHKGKVGTLAYNMAARLVQLQTGVNILEAQQ